MTSSTRATLTVSVRRRVSQPLSQIASLSRVVALATVSAGSILGGRVQAQSTWTSTAAGTYTWATGPWSGGVPNSAGATANIESALAGTETITVTNDTVGTLNIGASTPYAYKVSGGILTLNNNGSGAQINEVAGADGDSITSAIIMADSNSTAALTISNSGSATFGVSGGITSTGAGSNLVLEANSGAALSITSANNTGLITNAGTGTATTTISGVIGTNVTGVVENSSTSGLAINGANTFSGNVTITTGTVSSTNTSTPFGTGTIVLGSTANGNSLNALLSYGASAAGATVANNITVNAGSSGVLAILSTNNTSTFTGNIALNNTLTLADNKGGSPVTFSGKITGSAGLDIGNTGVTNTSMVVITGPNSSSYTGVTTVNSGTLSFTTGALGSGNIVTATGTLQYAAGNTTDNSSQLNGTATSALKVDLNGNALTYATQLTNTNVPDGLTVVSSTPGGVLVLDNNETYTGLTTIGTAAANSGTLQLGASGAGSLNSGNAVTTLAGGTFDVNGNNQTLGAVTNGGTITNSGSGTPTLTITGAGSDNGSITGALNLTIAPAGLDSSTTFTIGAGGTTANANNTYSGTTTIKSGVLALSADASLPNSSVVNNNGELEFLENSSDTSNLTRAGNVTLNGGAILVSNNTSASYSTDSITTLTLNQGNYTGGPSVNSTWASNEIGFIEYTSAGTPSNNSNSLLEVGTLVVNPDTTLYFSLTGSTTLGSGSINSQTGNTANVQISNFKVGGTTYSSASQLGSVLVGGGGAIGTTDTSILPFALASGNWVTYNTNNGVEALTTYDSSFAAAIAAGTGEENVKETGADSLSQNLTINSLILANPGNFNVNTNTLTITSGDLYFGSSAGIVAGTVGSQVSRLVLGTGTGNTATGYIYVGNGLGGAVSAVLSGPTAGLVINYLSNNNLGSFKLENTGSWSGGTIVNAGYNTNVGSPGGVDPFTFYLGNSTLNENGTLGSGTVTLNNATLDIAEYGTSANPYTYNVSNVITGSGAVSLTGTSTSTSYVTIVASGANTYTGPTTVNYGQLNINGSTAAASTFTVASGAAVGGTGTIGGAVTINAGGAINLHGSTSLASPTTPVIGTLTVGSLTINNTSSTLPTLTFDITSGTSSNLDNIVDNGALTLGGTNGITITVDNLTGALTSGTTLSSGTYTLLSYNSLAGAGSLSDFSLSNSSVDGATLSLQSGTNALDLVVTGGSSASPATGSFTSPLPSLKIITGTATVVTGTLNNVAAGGSNALNVHLTDDSTGSTGSFTSFSGSNPGTVTAGTGSLVVGTFTAGSAGTGTYGITNTDTASTNTTTSATGNVTVYTHAAGTLALTGASTATINAITGYQGTSSLTLKNNGANNDNLLAQTSGSSNLVTPYTGTLTANGSTSLTGTFTVGGPGSSTATFTQAWSEESDVVGYTPGTQSSTATITINSYTHSAANLSVTTDNLGEVHAGTTVGAQSTTLTNGGGSTAIGLQITSLSGGLSGGSVGDVIAASGSGETLSATVGTVSSWTINDVYTIGTEDQAGTLGGTTNPTATFTVTGNAYSGAGVWNTNGGGAWGTIQSPTNWTAAGGTPGLDPNFKTSDSASFGSVTNGGTATVTLGSDSPYLNNVTFNDSTASYDIEQGGTGTLHLSAAGTNTATINDNAGNHIIGAPIELDSASATSVAGGSTLTINGTISDSGTQTLAINGPGNTVLSGANTYHGATAVNSGTLTVSNGLTGSATGSGALTVGTNGTLTGAGQVNASSFAISGKLMVGNGTDTTSQTTLTGSGSNTISNAALQFNISAVTVGQGNVLNVGTSNIAFSNSTLTLNVMGHGVIPTSSDYVLIAGTGSGQYSGLGLETETIQGQSLQVITSGLALSFTPALASTWYSNGSVLFLNTSGGADDIEVDVVPEPGTWALMLGGLGMLVVWQRRRRS